MKYAIIHLADIHYQKEEPEGALRIVSALIQDLKNKRDTFLLGYDLYIAITGDIVFAGTDNEAYLNFFEEVNPKLNSIGLTKDRRMVVPGNHDLDRASIEQDFKSYQTKISENIGNERKFNNFINDGSYDNINKFENYELFESEFAKYGIDFSPGGNGWIINDNLGVYCLNTALSAFGGANKVNDEKKLAVYTRGLIDWCNSTKISTKILLMHHPISHLIKWSGDEVKQIIEEQFTVCLCGHTHEQDVFYNKISQKSLICSAPQVFTNKDDLLGYTIILIEENSVDKLIYREYVKGKFLKGQRFSENDKGIVEIHNNHLSYIKVLECKLKDALAFFKDQPNVFIKPKLSKEREFNDAPNLLDDIIKKPRSTIVVAHPQFGLTCLSHYMRLEAYKNNEFWIYLDAKHIKARKVESEIASQLKEFDKQAKNIKCIIIDSWDNTVIDHGNILKYIDNAYKGIPILVMSTYSGFSFDSKFHSLNLSVEFTTFHLQALERNKVREFISKYNQEKYVEKEDAIVTRVVKDLEALNIHRTPFNCLTLLKIFEKNFNENLVNRTKMIKAVLFILFTNSDSFTYSTNRPDVEDCEYVLGRFCKFLIERCIREFSYIELVDTLETYCKEKLVDVDVRTLIDILESNNILLRFRDSMEFKHSYWIYYFAAAYMLHDSTFKDYILNNRNYVNFPEIIEFYTGIDGRREAAIQTLLNDIKGLIDTVERKIGMTEDFTPFEGVVWNPSESAIETIRQDISEKVQRSNLPTSIKDQHADQHYNSEAPYDQSIHQFLNEFSVISLMQSIKASSRALRNSNYLDPELKKEMMHAILSGWEQISKILFWLSPTLAQKRSAIYDGLHVLLAKDHFMKGSDSERLKAIYLTNPYNVVTLFKDDLSSMKMGSLVFECLNNNESELQKHFIARFLIIERPVDWQNQIFDFMNLLHRNSFLLGDLYDSINNEMKNGFASNDDLIQLRKLKSIVVAKHEYAPKNKVTQIPRGMTINEANKLAIDRILASGRKRKFTKKP